MTSGAAFFTVRQDVPGLDSWPPPARYSDSIVRATWLRRLGLPHLTAHEGLCDQTDTCDLRAAATSGMRRKFPTPAVGHRLTLLTSSLSSAIWPSIIRRTPGLAGEQRKMQIGDRQSHRP